MGLRVACVGGGPGGLFLASLLKAADASSDVVVIERNAPHDTFGFGVVFSDATLGGLDDADPLFIQSLRAHCEHWDAIHVRVRGQEFAFGGNGMAAITRVTLLGLLYERAQELGVDMRFGTEVHDLGLLDEFDVVVACDGANSWYRHCFVDDFGLTVDVASAKFIWLGTTYPFEGLTFVHVRNADGVFAVHGYPIGDGVGTFIVETDEDSWARAGLDGFDVSQPPGPSDLDSVAYLERLFAAELGGHRLLANNSRWGNFRTIRNRTWRRDNLVLLGDAAHTAHFSVGSGTKMAMEDAIALAGALAEHPTDIPSALDAYETARRPSVDRIQNASRPSLSWWEQFGSYHDALDPEQFAFHFFSRSIGHAALARRDPGFIEAIEEWWRRQNGADPQHSPLTIGSVTLPERVVSVDLPRDDQPGSIDCGDIRVPLLQAWTPAPSASTWAAYVEAPLDDHDLQAATERAKGAIEAGASLVAAGGGTRLARVRLSEEVRMAMKVPSLVIEDDADEDLAVTYLLSGRADLFGVQGGISGA